VGSWGASVPLYVSLSHTHTQSRESSDHIHMRRVQRAQLQHATHTRQRENVPAAVRAAALDWCKEAVAATRVEFAPTFVTADCGKKVFLSDPCKKERSHGSVVEWHDTYVCVHIHTYILEGQRREGQKGKINQFAA
jgi:hypothetical protein